MKKIMFISIYIFLCITLFPEDVIHVLPTGEVGIGTDIPAVDIDIEVEGNVKITDDVILDGSGSTFTCTWIYDHDLSHASVEQSIPDAAGFSGKIIVLWKNGDPDQNHVLTFNVEDGTETIGGKAESDWKGQGTGKMILFSDGTAWQVEYYLDSGRYPGRGRFIKYRDGYMEQWGKKNVSPIPATITYPLVFAADPVVTVSAPVKNYYTQNGNGEINPGPNSFNFFCKHPVTGDVYPGTVTCHWHARGQWY